MAINYSSERLSLIRENRNNQNYLRPNNNENLQDNWLVHRNCISFPVMVHLHAFSTKYNTLFSSILYYWFLLRIKGTSTWHILHLVIKWCQSFLSRLLKGKKKKERNCVKFTLELIKDTMNFNKLLNISICL